MKEKLKQLYNNKILWIIFLCLIQIVFVSANLFYYSKTNYCCDIYITSPTDCEVTFVTPVGTTYIQNVKANVKFREYKRPLAEVHAPECAKLIFSSNNVHIIDVVIFTLKRLGLLWLGLTILCILPLSLYNKKWAILILQIPFVAIYAFLYFNTNYYCDFTIFSPQECVVQMTSPLGVTTNIHVPANENVYVEPNAIKDIEYPEYASVRFDSDTVSLVDVFDYYCRNRFFFLWVAFNSFLLLLTFLIHSWQPK